MGQTSESISTGQHRAASTFTLVIAGVVLLALLVFVFWDFFSRQVRWAWVMQADWGHTMVIPLIAGYFVYVRRDDLRAHPFRTTWVGLIPVFLGVAWYALCVFGPQPLWHHNLRGAGMGLTLFGCALLMFGWRAMLILWFPIAYYVLFGQTISYVLLERVTEKMQDVAAVGAELALQAGGLDIERKGNTLYVYEAGVATPHPLNVAEACSGMRMVMAFLALGVAMAYLGLSRFWQRSLLVASAIPTAIFVNVLRVATLAFLSTFDTEFAAGDFHTFIGLVWLVPAFLIYLGLQWIIRHLVVEESRDKKAVS